MPAQPTQKSGRGRATPSKVSLAVRDTVPSPVVYKVASVFLVLLVCAVGIVGNAVVVLVVLTT